MTNSVTSPVLAQQFKHASVRAFTAEPIPLATLETLIRAGQSAATSSFIQAYSVVRVTRPEARDALAEAAGGQVWIRRAAEFLVFCADMRRINGACIRAGKGELEGWAEHGIQTIVDTALMAQNVLLAAESIGLGGVFIGGIRNNPQVIVDQLKLPELVTPVFGMCLGWPEQHSPVKPRMPVDYVLHTDEYVDTTESQMAAYDATIAEYYKTRGSNVKLSDWSTATANAMQGKRREHMLPFLRARGFFKR